MNEIYKDKLSIIVNDELLIAALRAVFDEAIEKVRPTEETANSVLGEQYHAYLVAQKIIKQSFSDLDSYKVGKSPEKTFNKER